MNINLLLVASRPPNKPPPPPVPNRQGSNLSNQAHAKSTTALNTSTNETFGSNGTKRIQNVGSSNNISNMDMSLTNISIETPDSLAPPLPPHRIASQTSVQMRQAQPIPNNGVALNPNAPPPVVPQRHSSIRNSAGNGSITSNNRYPSSPNPNQSITKMIVDLESRYATLFHNETEFPKPKAFLSLEKAYPSRASLRQSTNGI